MKFGNWLLIWIPRIFGCHQRPDRSFWFKGHPFPICARCTGELAGILFGLATYWGIKPDLQVSIMLMIPMLVDGFLQMLTKYESKNWKRAITGFLFGYGLTSLWLLTSIFTFRLGMHMGK